MWIGRSRAQCASGLGRSTPSPLIPLPRNHSPAALVRAGAPSMCACMSLRASNASTHPVWISTMSPEAIGSPPALSEASSCAPYHVDGHSEISVERQPLDGNLGMAVERLPLE